MDRTKISPLKTIILPKHIADKMLGLARQSWPKEYAQFMLGHIDEESGEAEVTELYGRQVMSTVDSFRYNPNASVEAKDYALKMGVEFIGTIHSHPNELVDFDPAQLLISGRDSFFMFRIMESVRGIIAVNTELNAIMTFWAYGKHVPLKIMIDDGIVKPASMGETPFFPNPTSEKPENQKFRISDEELDEMVEESLPKCIICGEPVGKSASPDRPVHTKCAEMKTTGEIQ